MRPPGMLYLRGSGLLLVDKSNVRLLFCFLYPRLCLLTLNQHRKISAIITPPNIAKS